MRSRIVSNAIWNVVGGMSAAVVAVIVPPFLTRALSNEAYGAWSIALQIGTYVNLFSFGIQGAVGRYVAMADAKQDVAQRDGIVATSFWFLAAMGLIGAIGIAIAALNLHAILPKLNADLLGQTKIAMIFIGISFGISLPATVFAAVYNGLQKAHVPTIIQGSGRLVLGAGLVIGAMTHSLAVLGAIHLASNVAIVFGLWQAWRRGTHIPTLARHHCARIHGKELFGFCLSLSIWNLSMLLVSGLDLVIVGRYDYTSTAYYAVCVTLVTFVAGTLQALSNAIMPAAAAIDASNDRSGLQRLLVDSSRSIVAVSILLGAPLILSGHAILKWWVGPVYADHAALILAILTIVAVIRTAMAPHNAIAIGTGLHRLMLVTPLIEGVVCIILSFALVGPFGATGVAAAKILGGVLGVALIILQNPLRHAMPGLGRLGMLWNCLLRPALAWLPLVALYPVVHQMHPYPFLSLLLTEVVAVASVLALSVNGDQRRHGLSLVRDLLGAVNRRRLSKA